MVTLSNERSVEMVTLSNEWTGEMVTLRNERNEGLDENSYFVN